MSDNIKHECGIALVRLLKPMEYYLAKYGNAFYGVNTLYLLMEKQHNRGQDGAGIANIKFDVKPGQKYINIQKSNTNTAISDIFQDFNKQIEKIAIKTPERLNDINWLKENLTFTGELFLGHLRYGTFGKNSIENCHPFVRENNWQSKNLVIAGNFNLTNVDELFDQLINIGQHPKETTDTVTVLEKIAHFLDDENEVLFRNFKAEGYSKKEISPLIAENLSIQNVLTKSCKHWDGGYVIAGLIGHGDAFVLRDNAGIRPAYYYADDEIIVVTSERPAIQTALNVNVNHIKEIKPGNALIIKKNGHYAEYQCKGSLFKKSCSFERIYFSRGTDQDIYRERKKLGQLLTPEILKSVNYDIENTVLSYIPNTAAVAFYGLIEGMNEYCDEIKKERILQHKKNLTNEKLTEILKFSPRFEQIAVKDAKLRTFITQDNKRDDLVTHVYDITYGAVKGGSDNLVVVDDSIVRGTTLKKSIIRILDRLGPKKIVIASSAPQIRYPDCYGIDMAKLGEFIAFQAAIELLKQNKQSGIINEVYRKCKEQEKLPKERIQNYVKEIYAPFTNEQISKKIGELLKTKDTNAEVIIVYQTIENLHQACPKHTGDWYFTGDYPTPGGNKVVNKSFINYIEGRNERGYTDLRFN